MITNHRAEWLGVAGIAAFAMAGAVACSSSSSPPSKTNTPSDASSGETQDTGSSMPTLTVLNYLSWCSVTVNGGTASTSASIATPVTPGPVTIVVTPLSGFAIGADPWFGLSENDGGAAPGTDVGTGATETSTATVTVTGSQCVSVCCGFAPGGTSCPTTNPCP